ncbi:MAG: transporter [Verrucomicrobiales bacterium]|nr:transporter [Verrucomicrobiales bacterium]
MKAKSFSGSRTFLIACAVGIIVAGTVKAEPESRDKSVYHLFSPTPRNQMRELSPDRPDATESPVTVDAGHFVIETSLIDWRKDGSTDAYTTMATNLKVGLTNRSDLQLVFDTFSWEEPKGASGFSDIQLRYKYNLWGNDEGSTALALFPYIKIPTGTELSNGKWEGGLIIPFSVDLCEGISLGLMSEIDYIFDETSAEYSLQHLGSAVLGFDLTARLGAFVEYIGIAGETPFQSYLAGGFTLGISEDFVLDCGIQTGLNDHSEELGLFTGFTKRF